jgi:hypothetical protein
MTLTVTLNDLVDAVSEFARSDAEVVATVMHMLAKSRSRPLEDEGEVTRLHEDCDGEPVFH